MVVRHAKRMCNKRFYETYAQDGRDFIEFWLTADEIGLDLEKAYTCMRLFFNPTLKKYGEYPAAKFAPIGPLSVFKICP